MATAEQNRKRLHPVAPTAEDVLIYARQIWSRDPGKARSPSTENRDFQEFFGCGVLVFLALWSLLVSHDDVPEGVQLSICYEL